jgi:hypothetical protein
VKKGSGTRARTSISAFRARCPSRLDDPGATYAVENATCRIARARCSVFISPRCHVCRTRVAWSGCRTRPRANTRASRTIRRHGAPLRTRFAHQHLLTAVPIQQLDDLWIPAATRDRLVVQDRVGVDIETGRRHEEPLALTDVRRLPPLERILRHLRRDRPEVQLEELAPPLDADVAAVSGEEHAAGRDRALRSPPPPAWGSTQRTARLGFPSHSPTLRPWIAREIPDVIVEALWSPALAIASVKAQAKAAVGRTASITALRRARTFLSQAGPRFGTRASSS